MTYRDKTFHEVGKPLTQKERDEGAAELIEVVRAYPK